MTATLAPDETVMWGDVTKKQEGSHFDREIAWWTETKFSAISLLFFVGGGRGGGGRGIIYK